MEPPRQRRIHFDPFIQTGNGSWQLNLSGVPGGNYFIETSTNLIDWSLRAPLVNSNGFIQFIDNISPHTPARFYRSGAPK